MSSGARALEYPSVPGSRFASITGKALFVSLVVAFFLLSGASGLIYQVAWVRMLGLVFGVTVHAVSTVLAGFMAGLAVGSFVAGRFTERLRHPLRAYGIIECGIGATGLATPWAFGALRDAYPSINRWIESEATVWTGLSGEAAHLVAILLRFFIAFAILLVPTSLMGATLPVMLKTSLVRGSSLEVRPESGP